MRSLVPLAVLGALVAPSTALDCADGLQVLLVRGTGEVPGRSRADGVAQGIAARVAGSNVTYLDYPASLQDPPYSDSVGRGVEALKGTLSGYRSTCPGAKVAIVGYSQGAQVSTYAFCGGNGTEVISEDAAKDVVAILEFGDPSHVANATYNKGTSTRNGIFALDPDSVTRCEALGSRLRAYCDTGDVYCDRGDSRPVHGAYFAKYLNETVAFVVDRYEAAVAQSSTTVSPTASATMTGTGGAATTTGDAGSRASVLRIGSGDLAVYAVSLAVVFGWVL